MPHDTGHATTDETASLSTGQIVARLAREIAVLDPGPAAALRRGPQHGAGAAAFWKLLTRYGPTHELDGTREEAWAVLIQAMAILTPKGRSSEDAPNVSAHDLQMPMGAAVHDAGVSEVRLARLLTAPQQMRRTLTVRLCRRLAAAEQRRFDLKTLANFILFDADHAGRRIAREYYRAHAQAGRQRTIEETSPDA